MKTLIGIIIGVAITLAGYAVAAATSTTTVKISCMSDGTIQFAPVPQ